MRGIFQIQEITSAQSSRLADFRGGLSLLNGSDDFILETVLGEGIDAGT